MARLKSYLEKLGNPHDILRPYGINSMDFDLRTRMGKIEEGGSICSHAKILARELGEDFCRICHTELKEGIARYNDYLIIRNKECPSAICNNCAEKNPDKFHIAFKKAINERKNENKLIYG